MAEWINVKDELPLVQDDYLVYLPNGHIRTAYWMTEDFWEKGYYSNRLEVTHWMPLPEPPKEGADNA
ncbi:MAG: DUF551 domain-containing protein [Bacteroidales bacterium]|nr:DUF551 domain-containing protein [Bacteroidales bacterium]